MNQPPPEVSTNPDLSGYIVMPDIHDLQTCRNTCTYGNGCQKWTYDMTNNICYQKFRDGRTSAKNVSNRIKPSLIYKFINGDAGQDLIKNLIDYKSSSPPSDGHMSHYMRNIACISPQTTKVSATSISDCQQQCYDNPNCKYWVCNTDGGYCTLGTDTDEPYCRPVFNSVSGIIGDTRPSVPTSTYKEIAIPTAMPAAIPVPPAKPIYRVSSPMDDLTFIPKQSNSTYLSVQNADECRNNCISNDSCNAWSYFPNAKERSCALSIGDSDVVYRADGVISGRMYNVKSFPTALNN